MLGSGFWALLAFAFLGGLGFADPFGAGAGKVSSWVFAATIVAAGIAVWLWSWIVTIYLMIWS